MTTPDANSAELGHLLEGGSEDDEDFLDSGDGCESQESDGQEEEIEEEEEEEEYDRKGGKEKGKNTTLADHFKSNGQLNFSWKDVLDGMLEDPEPIQVA